MKKFFTKLFGKRSLHASSADIPVLRLHNTLSNELEFFRPLSAETVKMYNCGPTVYSRQHIGNLLGPVIFNVLRNILEYQGLEVRQVNNITDVGHLSGDNEGDADEGEDRMTRGMRAEGLELTLENMRTLGEKYAQIYLDDIAALNIPIEKIAFPRASNYIEEEIALVQTLIEKGYAYVAKEAVYFDVSRFAPYGKLGNIHLEGLREGARVEKRSQKHTPYDFALWKFDKNIGWESPWGRGFPGWHIECTAMIFKLLGRQIDIHTGGIEHIPIHHNNEIAQAEAASGKKFVNVWLHNGHVTIDGKKISKSLGNLVYLSDITERDLPALALRYWFLTAHYRTPGNFTWEAIEGAAAAYRRLVKFFQELPHAEDALPDPQYMEDFFGAITDDLDAPKALARVWDLVRDTEITPEVKRASLTEADKILGLGLAEGSPKKELAIAELPEEIQILLRERQSSRDAKDFAKSDALRDTLREKGYEVVDTTEGQKIHKI